MTPSRLGSQAGYDIGRAGNRSTICRGCRSEYPLISQHAGRHVTPSPSLKRARGRSGTTGGRVWPAGGKRPRGLAPGSRVYPRIQEHLSLHAASVCTRQTDSCRENVLSGSISPELSPPHPFITHTFVLYYTYSPLHPGPRSGAAEQTRRPPAPGAGETSASRQCRGGLARSSEIHVVQ